MKLDAEIDRLYGLPLDEFVGERDGLAKRLRTDGDREAADEVKALRKPTVGAWALNQALRRRKGERTKLLAAGRRLREAHEALLSGGDPSALRKAMAEERKLAGALADTAEVIASEAGKSGPALKDRVRGTLHAAALDDEVREELAAGRVLRERDAVGLGPFGEATLAPAPARSSRGGSKRGAASSNDSGDTEPGGGSSSGQRRGGASKTRGRGKRAGGAGAAREDAADRRRAQREEVKRERADREQAKRERAKRLVAAERSLAAAHAALAKADKAHDEAAVELDAARRAHKVAKAEEREASATKRERAKAVGKHEREVEKLRAATRRDR